ncbi:ExeA family protein [Thermithiobacillus plumbiphilus]|uniref:AAA family ATPase n=1 Tax=Thermithiobacillus plumbiphilus TaxID=1729899 RepID=A0ABU9D667_9PROT
MYLEFFGLREYPFGLTPDSSFFFADESRQGALDTLRFALESGEGFIKISGEVGTGKTTLCRYFLQSLGPDTISAYILNPQLEPRELLQAVARELTLSLDQHEDGQQALQAINQALLQHAADGKRVILLIDEAQALSTASLETVRLLSNLETEKRKLLQIMLFGQPELDSRLEAPEIRQLRQRIAFNYTLRPLRQDESGAYLEHRLRLAGYRGWALFSPGARRLLHRASRGIPRLINLLAHKALLAAYGQGRRQISRRELLRALDDTPQAFNVAFWRRVTGF